MIPSSGQLIEDEEREPTSPAMPGEGIRGVKPTSRRTVVVRLLPNGSQERKLRRLADASARLYNELNYARRRQFFEQGKLGLRRTWKKYYEKYKGVLGENAQAVMQKNNEAWNSFFSLLKAKKEGRLPQFGHVSPPKYWKEAGKRKLSLVVRQDRYKVDAEGHKLILKDFGMETDFAGRLRWYGKQGRLEICYDEAEGAWYASIPVEVGSETTSKGNKSSYIVQEANPPLQELGIPHG
jgi:putative transposase